MKYTVSKFIAILIFTLSFSSISFAEKNVCICNYILNAAGKAATGQDKTNQSLAKTHSSESHCMKRCHHANCENIFNDAFGPGSYSIGVDALGDHGCQSP